MRRLAWATALGLVVAVGCGGRQDIGATTPGASGDWDRAWASVAEGSAPSADAGEWVIESTSDGSIHAHHRTKRVSGGALGEIDDTVLEGRVYATLAAHKDTRGKNIGVQAENGVITLTGRVDGSLTASAAVRRALSVPDVGEVTSRLTWIR